MTDLQLIKLSVQRLKVLGFGSQKEIGKLLGYSSESAFSQVLNGKVNVPADLIDRIANLSDDVKNFIINNKDKDAIRIEAKPLRLADPYSLDATNEQFYKLADGSLIMQVPIISQRAYAGYLVGFADPEFYDDLETIPAMVDGLHRGSYLAFEVIGDSMICFDTLELAEQSIFPGRIAIGRDLPKDKWKYRLHTHTTDTWVIVHRTKGILIKHISGHDVENGIITIHSLNPAYEDEDLKLHDIEQIFSVVQILTRKRK